MINNIDGISSRVGNSPITIGRFTYQIEHVTIREWGEGAALSIGSFCSIANKVSIFLGGNHRLDWITTFPFGRVFVDELAIPATPGHPATNGDVVIGHDVWIGHGATIMSGVTIGSGAVVAANSHVVSDVLPYQVVGGNPARPLRRRFDDRIIALLLELRWWDLPLAAIREIAPLLTAAPDAAQLSNLVARHRVPA